MKKVLFVCVGNSGRSQMAEAFSTIFRKNGRQLVLVYPDEQVHPWTLKVMREVGIDVSEQKPKKLKAEMIRRKPTKSWQ